MPNRTVFFISDGTGITAETFGNSIMAQFAIKSRHIRRPFIDTVDKAHQVVREINTAAEREGKRPIVFMTLVDEDILEIIRPCRAKVFDMIKTFVEPLERGVIDRADVLGELAQLVTGEVPGRTSDAQITLFKSVGTAIEDLAAARLLLQNAGGDGG